MIVGLYVIFDTTAGESSMPFDAKTDKVAKRRFEDTVNRQIRGVETVKPEEYELRCIGQFDTEKCAIDKIEYPSGRVVCNGSQVDFWPEEVMAKYRQPTFDMDLFNKKMAEYMKKAPTLPPENLIQKPKKAKWFMKK